MTGKSRSINWLNVITVISAAILIGAEVFGAAFAASWAIATLLGLDQVFRYTLDAVLFGCGLAVMVSFMRSAQRVEPFFARRLVPQRRSRHLRAIEATPHPHNR